MCCVQKKILYCDATTQQSKRVVGEESAVELKEHRYWSPTELASVLRVSPETVRRALRHGTISGIRVGRQWRIPDGEYRRLLEQGLGGDIS